MHCGRSFLMKFLERVTWDFLFDVRFQNVRIYSYSYSYFEGFICYIKQLVQIEIMHSHNIIFLLLKSGFVRSLWQNSRPRIRWSSSCTCPKYVPLHLHFACHLNSYQSSLMVPKQVPIRTMAVPVSLIFELIMCLINYDTILYK